MIKAILFDLTGVLLNNPMKEYAEAISAEHNLNFKDIFKIFHNNNWKKFKLGRISEKKYWIHVSKKLKEGFLINLKKKDINKFYNYFSINSDLLKLIARIKPKFKTALISNLSKEWMLYLIRKHGLNDYFDVIVTSGEIGVDKPNKRIYDAVIKKLKVTFRECLYVDDKEEYIKNAERFGLNAFTFKNNNQISRIIKKAI